MSQLLDGKVSQLRPAGRRPKISLYHHLSISLCVRPSVRSVPRVRSAETVVLQVKHGVSAGRDDII